MDEPVTIEPEPAEGHGIGSAHPVVSGHGGMRSVVMSIAFWLTLLTAAGLYASVALAPKLADWIRVRQCYLENADRLAQLESRADHAERLAAVLRRNPGSGPAPDASVLFAGLPADPDPLISGDRKPAGQSAGPALLLRPEVVRLISLLATSLPHRKWLLAAAAALAVFGFTFLNDDEWRCPSFFRRWLKSPAARD